MPILQRVASSRLSALVCLAALLGACDNPSNPPPDAAELDAELDTAPETDTESDEFDETALDAPDDADAAEDEIEDPGVCTLVEPDPDFAERIGCFDDFVAVSAPPLVASIPGVRSTKTVLDRLGENALYFQNSRRYPIHWDFASAHLSGNGLPIVPPLSQFNQSEYYTPDRRFLLGALNYYEGPRIWAYEIAPYDTASAEMIATAFYAIRDHHWRGDVLRFHPTSDNVAREAAKLPADIPVVSTEELYAGIIYQPLNLATAMGQLRFFSSRDLSERTKYLSFRDIAVLESIPNDLAVCSGTITHVFQTPLSHINVLAQNRGTPNMGLLGAFENPDLRALEGRWVELSVGATEYSLREVSQAEADAWWESHRPAAVSVPSVDLSVTALTDIEDVLDIEGLGLAGALAMAIPAFGGKASHFGAFPHIPDNAIPYPKAFVIPIFYYDQFMKQHGLDAQVDSLLADPEFQNDPAYREAALATLRMQIQNAPLDPDFEAALLAKLASDYPGLRMKFRSSTNCEDLDGFTGAGLYQSFAGDPNDPDKSFADAVRGVWSSVWGFRAFEERAYRSISHREVGMAVLVHRAYPAEDSNGVAITANIFDPLGVEPGYYINAQVGDTSVVLPPEGVTSDQFVYHFDMPGQPIVYFAHSSLVPDGSSVLTRAEVETLGQALDVLHRYFDPVYGPSTPEHFYALDVEWKFDQGELVIKQARPYPGRGSP